MCWIYTKIEKRGENTLCLLTFQCVCVCDSVSPTEMDVPPALKEEEVAL